MKSPILPILTLLTTAMTTPPEKQPTRLALFKFLPSTTPSQKHDRATAFLALYAQHEDLIVAPPRGGKPLNTPLELTNVSRVAGWDMGFVVRFRSEAARKEFDADPGHDELKKETDVLLEKVMVYDFLDEENLGW